ncbi:MAG: hypothetical protein JNL58_01295 [Planctomyces sp.]|nr:hypothetical protein [Planctomyces sp.]
MLALSIWRLSVLTLVMNVTLASKSAAADALRELRNSDGAIEQAGPEIRALSSIRLIQRPSVASPPLAIPADVPRPAIQSPQTTSVTDLWIVSPAHEIAYPHGSSPNCFEDAELERCGKACGCLTEAVSVLHFGSRIALLPVLMSCER